MKKINQAFRWDTDISQQGRPINKSEPSKSYGSSRSYGSSKPIRASGPIELKSVKQIYLLIRSNGSCELIKLMDQLNRLTQQTG